MHRLLRKFLRKPVVSSSGNIFDVSFQTNSPSGFIGRLARDIAHPSDSGICDLTNPVLWYGCVGIETPQNTIRGILPSDTDGTQIVGIAAQPFPYQAEFATQGYGAQPFTQMTAPAPGRMMTFQRHGFVDVYCNGAATVTKAQPVYVWTAASTGAHIQGMFEATPTTGSTVIVPKAIFYGPGEATGVVRVAFNL